MCFVSKPTPQERALLEEARERPTLACRVYNGLQVDGAEHERDLLAQKLAARGLLACVEPVGFRQLPCGGSESRYTLTRAGREAIRAETPPAMDLAIRFGRARTSPGSS